MMGWDAKKRKESVVSVLPADEDRIVMSVWFLIYAACFGIAA